MNSSFRWMRLRGPGAFLWCLILLTCLAKIVPFSPDMPSAGLDGSWRIGLEQAAAQGMVFGRDILFTFGPYASVYTRNYHPASNFLMLAGSLYLALSYTALLGWLSSAAGRVLPVMLLLLSILSLVYVPDTLWLAYPLFVALLLYCWWPLAADSHADDQTDARLVQLVVLFLPLGLLPLIKGTMLALGLAATLLSTGYLLIQRRTGTAIVCFLVPPLGMPIFWLLSGQPLWALPVYLHGMAEVIAGYSESMAYYGVIRESLLYLGASGVLLVAVARLPGLRLSARLYLLLMVFGFLFICFKAGFVRQDSHAVIASAGLLMAALGICIVQPTKMVLASAVITLLPWAVIDHHYQKTSPASMIATLGSTYRGAWYGARRRLLEPDWPRGEFDGIQRTLRRDSGLPLLPGRSDIYSYKQAELIASGNQWSPRPVLQSYSAYTPALAEANRAHLQGAGAPENIFFDVETIDGRYPSMDDGPSWPLLLTRYEPAGRYHGLLLLKRNGGASEDGLNAVGPAILHRFGEPVSVPPTDGAWLAHFAIQPSVLGGVAGLLFRPSQLEIAITLATGEQKKYRLVSGMASAGFMLSPLIENSEEFALLYNAGHALDHKLVTSLTVGVVDTKLAWLWQDRYTLMLTSWRSRSAPPP